MLTFPDAPPLAAPGTEETLDVERQRQRRPLGLTAFLVPAWPTTHGSSCARTPRAAATCWRFINEDGEPAAWRSTSCRSTAVGHRRT